MLKRSGNEPEATFVASLCCQLPMMATPLTAADGRWVHNGWTATAWVDGEPDPARWDDVLEMGVDLHSALERLDPPWPVALDRRTTPWAIADRVAWGEQPIPDGVTGLAAEVTQRALAATVSDTAPRQVVHGDLAANVLFPEAGPPVVIDLSPYCRPVAFATAVAVVDQVVWYGAPPSRASLVDASDLARAIVFHVAAAAIQSPAAGAEEARRGQRLLD